MAQHRASGRMGASGLAHVLAFALEDEQDSGGAEEPFPRIPGYRVIGRLGEGGMGRVWRAEQLATRRIVALKLLAAGSLSSVRARARFEREVELASRLEHPGIARVYDSGIAHGVAHYAMELIEGIHLDDFVRQNGLGTREILGLMREVCEAVQHAHQRGVIHRDIKPSNVLVTTERRTCVLDFGLARAMLQESGAAVTFDGEASGTPAYMAPEQAAGDDRHIDTRTDVYGLGATLYVLLTGKTPHEMSGARHEALRRIVEEDVVRPRAVREGIDAELESILIKALARDPGGRYASAGEMGADIRRYLEGDPLVARPPTLAYFARRQVAKHRGPVLVGVGVLVLLLGLAGFDYHRIISARNLAVARQNELDVQKGQLEVARNVSEAHLTDSIVSEAKALGQADRWFEAREKYVQARQRLLDAGRPTLETDLGLLNTYRVAPPVLNQFSSGSARINETAVAPDGRHGATAGTDGAVNIWDLRRGRVVRPFRIGATEAVHVAFTPDGTKLAASGKDGEVRVWDLGSDNEPARYKVGSGVTCMAISPDGALLAAGDRYGGFDVWNLNQRTIPQHLTAHELSCLAFGPDARFVYSSIFLDRHDLQGSERNPFTTVNTFIALAVAPDGQRFYSLDADQFGVTALHCYAMADTPAYWTYGPAGGSRVGISGDGALVFGIQGDSIVALHASNGQLAKRTYTGVGQLQGVSWSLEDEIALSTDWKGTLYVWDMSATETDPSIVQDGHHDVGLATEDGRLFVGRHGTLVEYDLRTQEAVSESKISEDFIQVLQLGPDGRSLLVGLSEGAGIFDCESRRYRVLIPKLRDVRAVEWSRDGRAVMIANGNGPKWLDVKTGYEFQSAATLAYGGAKIDDDGTVICVDVHGGVTKWEVASGRHWRVCTLDTPTDIIGNVVFLDGQRQILGEFDSTVVVWDARTGKRVKTLQGHAGKVARVAVSADRKMCASLGTDNTVRIWDLREGRELQAIDVRTPTGQHISLSPDNRWLVLCGQSSLQVVDLGRFSTFMDWEGRVAKARAALEINPDDKAAMETVSGWYAFRGRKDWAAEVKRPGEDGERTFGKPKALVGATTRP